MKKIELNAIRIFEFGNKYTMKGMVFGDPDGKDTIIVTMPQENISSDGVKIINPDMGDWHLLLAQLDMCEVEGIRDEEKVILRKGQRNIDGKISWKVFRRDGYKCRYCAIDHVPLTVDHIVTWETGGATHPKNLLTSCRKCNKKRGNMSYQLWMVSDYYKDKSQYLTEAVKEANLKIVDILDTLPRVQHIRKR